jgi:hypothetical protein
MAEAATKDSTTPGEKLWSILREQDRTHYGDRFPISLVHSALGILVPKVGSRRDFERIALIELAAIDYVKNRLVDEGKWLTRQGSEYYIPLPSENAHFIDNMLASAQRKLKRARRLRSNTQAEEATTDQTASKILMIEDSVKSARKRRDLLK